MSPACNRQPQTLSERFAKNIMHYTDNSDNSIKKIMFAQNLKTIRLAAILVVLVNNFWLLFDASTSHSLALNWHPAFFAVLLQIASSVGIFVYSLFCRHHEGCQLRLTFILYYICMMVGISLLLVSKNNIVVEHGGFAYLADSSIVAFYLFIMAFAPLPARSDSIVISLLALSVPLVPLFFPSATAYHLLPELILTASFLLSYFYFRRVNIRLACNMISVDRLNRQTFLYTISDPATCALNKRALQDYCNHLAAEGVTDKTGVLIFDIDFFKSYNDFYSHAEGDLMLQNVCAVVQSVLTREDAYLFRFGGDEFVIACASISDEELLSMALRIKAAVWDNNFVRNDQKDVSRLSITVGCARVAVKPDSLSDFIDAADASLYHGKQNGKNCVSFGGEIFR